MGILNITDDSFYAGSRFLETDHAADMAGTMLEEGASVLDLGGYSSRPGAKDISEQSELDRIIPAIETISKAFPKAIISVDTFRSKVAQLAVTAGASMINDISAGEDDSEMIPTAARLQIPYVAMHKKGTPQNMNLNPQYENVTLEVLRYLIQKSHQLQQAGIHDIIWDPGFGFGKTIQHNFDLMRHFEDLTIHGFPVLAGVSRKSMIWRTLNVQPEEALNGTTALHMLCLAKGASILRVHDVKEAVECVRLWRRMIND